MKKQCVLGLILLLSFAGCGGWKKKKSEETRSSKTEVFSEVDIPVASEEVMRSFFDEDVKEFAYVEEPTLDESAQAIDVTQAYDEQLSWDKVAQHDNFTPIYFDFDSDSIKADQEKTLADAIDLIKKKIEKYEHSGSVSPMTVVVEGHSDHAAGAPIYNFALSERRANKLKNRLVAAGIPQEYIKVVGRGQEIPAIVDGKPVSGDRYEQWANRRDEIRIIFA
ncbi:MAG: OmpA family protein [Candidatus Dependentiae bacterium]|nr:OmpA family protein [Candidatus Dependentiae bacterium]